MADSTLTIVGLPNGLEYSRLGLGVSSRHGGAVQRNRAKRLCREAFRLIRAELPAGWDFIVIPRAGREMTVARIQSSLRPLTARMASQGPAPSTPKPPDEGAAP